MGRGDFEMSKTNKLKADLLVENVEKLTILSKLMNEKLDETTEWHGRQNGIFTKLLIFIAFCSSLTAIFLALIYFNL